MFASRTHPPAPLAPTRVSANACADHFDVYDEPGQENFESALRFGLNQPCKRPHLSLTALARVERWAGFYVHGNDAIGATASFTIVTITAAMHDDLAVRAADDVCYAQILNPV